MVLQLLRLLLLLEFDDSVVAGSLFSNQARGSSWHHHHHHLWTHLMVYLYFLCDMLGSLFFLHIF